MEEKGYKSSKSSCDSIPENDEKEVGSSGQKKNNLSKLIIWFVINKL